MSNYDVMQKHGGLPIKCWTQGVGIEESAKQQLSNLSGMPFIHKHIAVMPDCHWGMGSTVGSVIATLGAVIPAAVGVDIGCGMIAQRTSLTALDLPSNLHLLRSAIEAAIPHGRTDNGGLNDQGAFHTHRETAFDYAGLQKIVEKHPKLERAAARAPYHVGTLGSGNHFIEICLDEEDRVWIMIHSGSRGIGNAIGTYFTELAKKEMERWYINLPDKDLAYIPQGSVHFKDYLEAVHWAQEFAALNRHHMMTKVRQLLVMHVNACWVDEQAIECHHNYVTWERHFGQNVLLTRKGAVNAETGRLGIIPGSMGAKSFIVRGKGNPESFNSCSHGAGRVMSRNQARSKFTLEDHALATEGVECRKDAEVIDETPGAYKDIDKVMAAQSDLVDIVHTLKQVLCVKG